MKRETIGHYKFSIVDEILQVWMFRESETRCNHTVPISWSGCEERRRGAEGDEVGGYLYRAATALRGTGYDRL